MIVYGWRRARARAVAVAASLVDELRERELIHGRWAMLAAVGVLVPECTAKLSLFGTPGQHW